MDRLETTMLHIDRLLAEADRIIVAIDGSCTAGKTTLAAQLAEAYDCNLFHMDDFFLRAHQRTPERYAEIGGNVDYERFYEEVLLPLKAGNDFSYRPFSCKALSLGAPIQISTKQLNIIEGSYSIHPYFGDPYDLKILLTVTPDLQQQRVLKRPTPLHKQFFEQWIPMENRYLADFQIAAHCDLIF